METNSVLTMATATSYSGNISSSPPPPPKPMESFLFAFCHFVDFPKSGIDCSQQNPEKCVECRTKGSFWTGESIHDYHSVALGYLYFLWVILVITSVFGILSNILIITVFRRKQTNRSFDFLLIMLAIFDIFCSTATMVAGTSSVAYFGNWFGRGLGSLYWCFLGLYTSLFARSLSTYMAILITIERFCMITFPVKANVWFTPTRTKVMTLIAVLLAIFLNYPRYASWTLEKNNWKDVKSLQELEYVLRPSAQGKFWYKTLGGIHNQIDFWLPLPVLLFFNLLSYWKVVQLSKRRKEMNMKEKRDIRAVKMFLPVVVAYFITNIGPIANLFFVMVQKVTYREFYMLVYLSIAVNSAINLPIYYFRSSAFKEGAKEVLSEWLWKLGWKKGVQKSNGKNQENTNGTTSDSGF